MGEAHGKAGAKRAAKIVIFLNAYFGQNGQPFRSKAASVSDQRGQVNAAERRWV